MVELGTKSPSAEAKGEARLKRFYGVIELKNSEGETVKVFQIKNTTYIAALPEEEVSCVIDFFEDKKESQKLYYEKLETFIDQHLKKKTPLN